MAACSASAANSSRDELTPQPEDRPGALATARLMPRPQRLRDAAAAGSRGGSRTISRRPGLGSARGPRTPSGRVHEEGPSPGPGAGQHRGDRAGTGLHRDDGALRRSALRRGQAGVGAGSANGFSTFSYVSNSGGGTFPFPPVTCACSMAAFATAWPRKWLLLTT